MRTVLAIGFLLALLNTPSSYAQSDQEPAADEAAPPPVLNVRPAGLARQDWEDGYAAILALPSPLGPALPGLLVVETGANGAQATLVLDDSGQTYSYDCPSGRCTAFAADLWDSLPADTRLAYVNSVMDALMDTYPGGRIYFVQVGAHALRLARMSWTPDRGRTYVSYPPL